MSLTVMLLLAGQIPAQTAPTRPNSPYKTQGSATPSVYVVPGYSLNRIRQVQATDAPRLPPTPSTRPAVPPPPQEEVDDPRGGDYPAPGARPMVAPPSASIPPAFGPGPIAPPGYGMGYAPNYAGNFGPAMAACCGPVAPGCYGPAMPGCYGAPAPSCYSPAMPGCFGPAPGCWGSGSPYGFTNSGQDDYPCPDDDDEDDDDGTKIKKLGSTCDLYPHYAYYPAYHGYYYFRPYNYTSVFGHQQFAHAIGLDPRMPYSFANFQRIYADFPMQFTPQSSPIGSALPSGSGLPELEAILDPKSTN